MLTADQVPMAVKRAMRAAWARRNNGDAPEKHMADLAVAAINAWPGMTRDRLVLSEAGRAFPAIILPLPAKEGGDE